MKTVDIQIRNDDGEVTETLVIKRLKRKDLANFLKMQELLLSDFIYFNGAIGSLIADKGAWSNIEKAAKLIPVLEGDKTVPLDLSKIGEDYLVLAQLFFTASITEETLGGYPDDLETVGYKPSLLTQLNHLDYGGALGKGVLDGKERQKERIMALIQIRENQGLLDTPPETQKPTI